MAKPTLRFLLLIIPLLPALARGQSDFSPDVSPAQAQHAMVVSIHHDASDAGLKMLQAGGNAVDAAVATGFALAVVYPYAGNLGGGGFMLLRLANGESHFLDFREEAPLRATANMYLDAREKSFPTLPRSAICRSAFRARWPAWSKRSGALASSRCSK